MDDPPGPRRNPFAIPYSALVADSRVSCEQLVVEAAHEPPPDYSSAGASTAGDGGDGE
jgi:hypothetical protein